VRFDNSKIEEIRNRIDIVDFVSQYLTLKKREETLSDYVLSIKKRLLLLR